MIERRDIVVVGGGAMGSAAAWQLARSGREVTLLERFAPRHHEGASHGALRNFNVSYSRPEYLAMLVEARRLWRELEEQSGVALLEQRGLVDHGSAGGFDEVRAAVSAAGFRAEFLSVEEASERWAGIRFDTRVLHFPDGGTVRADDSVTAMQAVAARDGADIRHNARVAAIRVTNEDAVDVEFESGERIVARRVVVTAGAWTEKLIGGSIRLPRLVVTQEQPAHFAVRDDAVDWPSFNHLPGDSSSYGYWPAEVYGLLTPGEGLKVGWHRAGPIVDPDNRDYRPRTGQREALRRYARDWLPGVDADELTDISCTYTSTDDSNFVIDRTGPLVIGAGFSGHGFKFTPTVGRMLADLATGVSVAPALFAAQRP